MSKSLLDAMPVWAIFLGTVALMLGAVELGRRVGARQKRHGASAGESNLATIVGATLGLFAFLLAFTFGAAAARYDARRQLVIDDANAIGTTYLRAELLPAEHRDEVRRLLRESVAARSPPGGPERLEEGEAPTERWQRSLWARAVASARESPTPVMALFIQTLNQMIDVHSERLTVVVEHRVPADIWMGLYVVAGIAMMLMGYQVGVAGGSLPGGLVLLILAFAMVIVLIAALDRPSGGLSVSQEVMHSVEQRMEP